jgi:hypothetical protein
VDLWGLQDLKACLVRRVLKGIAGCKESRELLGKLELRGLMAHLDHKAFRVFKGLLVTLGRKAFKDRPEPQVFRETQDRKGQ